MTLSKLSIAVLSLSLATYASKAEEVVKPEAPKTDVAKSAETKPDEAKPADAKPADAVAKPKADGELPKAPEGLSPVNEAKQNETFVGELSKGLPEGGKPKSEKKAAKAKLAGDALTLHVAGHADGAKGKKAEKGAKNGQNYTLIASGELLAQLTNLAEKHAHVKVTGALSGETLTVKEVSEAPADATPEKKKKKKDA
ncbi:MAG: hypothetical protein WCT04_06435 [Planctomycetota bacterium]